MGKFAFMLVVMYLLQLFSQVHMYATWKFCGLNGHSLKIIPRIFLAGLKVYIIWTCLSQVSRL